MCTKSHAQEEIMQVKNWLDERGMSCDVRDDGSIHFYNKAGECWAVASQTYDGLIYVRYTASGRVKTAAEVLQICEVINESI